jgi:hypothetical protein
MSGIRVVGIKFKVRQSDQVDFEIPVVADRMSDERIYLHQHESGSRESLCLISETCSRIPM